MKIYLGGYTSHWETKQIEDWYYQLRYKKYSWDVSKKDKDRLDKIFDAFMNFWEYAVCFPVNTIKGFIPRTSYIKIDNYDCWSMDSTLSLIILPMLLKLQENKHGAPFTEDEDVPEELRSTSAPAKENEYDTDENHFKRWDWILNEMIWAFTQINDDDDEAPYRTGTPHFMFQAVNNDGDRIGEPTEIGKRSEILDDEENLMFEMINGPNDTHKVDYAGLEIHWARIKNGTRLFGKYFQNLWD